METMRTICIRSRKGVDLLQAVIEMNGRPMEVCGLAKESYKDGYLWQWWILMGQQEKQA